MDDRAPQLAYALFPTAIGTCAVVWRPAGAIVGAALPHGSYEALRRVHLEQPTLFDL